MLDRFFRFRAPVASGDRLVVAFSGGPDSTALLTGLTRLSRRRGWRLLAAHLDHGLDPDSSARAAAARRIARHLGVAFVAERCSVPALRRAGESPEAAARRIRYRFLERVRRGRDARWVVTAHHRDDQVETVLLRLLFGSGWEGLVAIQPRHRRVVRPLLDLPRRTLEAVVRRYNITPLEDATNRDLSLPRNRLRHLLVPRLENRWPDLGDRLARLPPLAARARRAVADRLAAHLPIEEVADGTAVPREALAHLPPALLPSALALLHRRAGVPHPAGRDARRELVRQLATGTGAAGVDCGGGFRWEIRGSRLVLVRPSSPTPPPRFAYTLQAPGERIVDELALGFRLTRGPRAPWMFRGSPRRAGLALGIEPGDRVEIRNRRPGDRLRPLGSSGARRLKEVLIDRRVPRERRDRLPLLVVNGRIAWVPGVTVDHRFRLPNGDRRQDEDERGGGHATTSEDETRVWIAEIFDPSKTH